MAAERGRKSRMKSKARYTHLQHHILKSTIHENQHQISDVFKTNWKLTVFFVTTILLSYYVLPFVVSFVSSNTEEYKESRAKTVSDKRTPIKGKLKMKAASIHEKKLDLAEKENFEETILSKIVIPNDNFTYAGRKMVISELKHRNAESSVKVYVIDDFLTKEECNGLSTAHLSHVQKWNDQDPILCFSDIHTFRKYLKDVDIKAEVTENDFTHGTNCLNETFSSRLKGKLLWSFSTAFYPIESKFSQIYEDRVERVTGLIKSHGGKFQITSYPEKAGYKTHTDCTINSSELRDRYATTLVYLQNVRKGGETIFTNLGISVQPKQGRLLVWNNMDQYGECDPTSIHQAAPVANGRKYILQRWYYYKNFPSLGKRMPEPKLPKRKELQARVTCDRYEEGSCRWYDEWGYDHLK